VRWLGSRCGIDYLGGIEDVPATYGVAAPLNASAADQVNLSAIQRHQFVLHRHVIAQTLMRIGSKGHEHIHVTHWAKVVPEHRAEERKLGDLPAAAELK
jgi:hypothetical protein